MKNNRVELSVDNGIALVKLNRPEKHNALDFQMFCAIDQCIKTIRRNRAVRAVVVSGNGESFCSGIDIKSLLSSKSSALKLLAKWLPGNANLAQRVCIGWRRLSVPVIMVLHGKCWGGGMQIALGGDFRIAETNCSLAVMESKWGLIPDMGGTNALLKCIAADQSMKLAMTATPISAEHAQSIGLVTQVSEQPFEAAMSLAKQLADRSPDTNKAIKVMYHKLWNLSERRVLALETYHQIKILFGKNQRIAVKRSLNQSSEKFKL
ncbi:crotonase/enoyl-CoA hydratase family protein [Aliikangiella sp. IMCC44632]